MKKFQILLEYPINPIPRYGYGKPPHPGLYEIINQGRDMFKNTLNKFLGFKDELLKIPIKEQDLIQPCWINGWLPGFDTVSLYCFLSMINPNRYVEIGSGYSTRIARKAIVDNDLKTQIISIDPHPRAEIDSICDTVIRCSLEEADLNIFGELGKGDLIFVDGSHRCFMNSDVTVVFLDILFGLRSGITIGFHDIMLPYDYPPAWRDRCYSEQYLLAVLLLANNEKFKIKLANCFISMDSELSQILSPLWSHLGPEGVEKHGSSFWLETA